MRALVVAAAFLGAILGAMVATALQPWLRRRLGRGGRHPEARLPGGDDSTSGPLARMIVDVKGMLERVQEDVNTLSDRVSRLASQTPARGEYSGGTGVRPGGVYPTPGSGTQSTPEARGQRDYGTSPSVRRDEAGLFQGSGLGTPGGADYGGSGGEFVLEDTGSLDPAVVPTIGPPANALNVEARDDRIVTTSSYPPEAWLVVGPGPAEGSVSLNPAVALNEYALRRLSTFFEWQGARAGSTYQTVKPATVRWDDGQRVGSLVSRGVARPR